MFCYNSKPYINTIEQRLYRQYIVLPLLQSKCFLVKILAACRSLLERCTVYMILNKPNARQTSRPTCGWSAGLIEFLEFFFFSLFLHSPVFIHGILFMHFALCYRHLYVCLRVRMPCFWTSGKGHEIVMSLFFFKLRAITPDTICKSLTQIRLHISRWRTKWRPWNAIIDCNSTIY